MKQIELQALPEPKKLKLGKFERLVIKCAGKSPGGNQWPGRLKELRRLASKGILVQEGMFVRSELTAFGKKIYAKMEKGEL